MEMHSEMIWNVILTLSTSSLGEDYEIIQNYHLIPQSLYVYDNFDTLLVDDVFRLEEIDKMEESLSDRYNITVKLPKRNATQRKDYRQYYDEETKLIIENIYSEDIKRFGYSYE